MRPEILKHFLNGFRFDHLCTCVLPRSRPYTSTQWPSCKESKCTVWVVALLQYFAECRQERAEQTHSFKWTCPESHTYKAGRVACHFIFFTDCSINFKSVCLLSAFWSACQMSFEDIIIKIQSKSILWVSVDPNYKNWVIKVKLWWELATKLGIQGQFLYIQGGPKVSVHLRYPNWAPPRTVFCSFLRKYWFSKNNCLTEKYLARNLR